MSKSGAGRPVRRVEGLHFLTGAGRYVDDIDFEGQAYAYVVRSSSAHGRIPGLGTDSARGLPGVIDVVTAGELEVRGANTMGCEIALTNRDSSRRANPVRPPPRCRASSLRGRSVGIRGCRVRCARVHFQNLHLANE
jgi:carbon-monoxide dehydrogenase large subunit